MEPFWGRRCFMTVRPEEPCEARRLEGQTESAFVGSGQRLRVTSVYASRTQAAKVFLTTFDESLFLFTPPTLDPSFHLECFDAGVEFLVPDK